MVNITIKRVYDKHSSLDGYRVLVDRLWARGISKAKVHHWMKDIGPSTELRKWYGHQESKWAEFKKRYRHELRYKKEYVAELLKKAKKYKTLTLVYASKSKHNNAIVLANYLKRKLREKK